MGGGQRTELLVLRRRPCLCCAPARNTVGLRLKWVAKLKVWATLMVRMLKLLVLAMAVNEMVEL